jgi:hypothetical protein
MKTIREKIRHLNELVFAGKELDAFEMILMGMQC